MTEEKPVLYVVDDDPSVLKSLERLLRSAGYEVKTFTSGIELLDLQYSDTPGCIVLDVKMPEMDGIELQEHLTNTGIMLPIIFITGHGTIPLSVRAMKAGAIDFLQKPFSDRDLLKGISAAVTRDREAKREQKELMKLHECQNTLTAREHEVLKLVSTGLLNKQIAFELGITEKTVKVHRGRVMQKMEAQSLADLVRFADKLKVHTPEI